MDASVCAYFTKKLQHTWYLEILCYSKQGQLKKKNNHLSLIFSWKRWRQKRQVFLAMGSGNNQVRARPWLSFTLNSGPCTGPCWGPRGSAWGRTQSGWCILSVAPLSTSWGPRERLLSTIQHRRTTFLPSPTHSCPQIANPQGWESEDKRAQLPPFSGKRKILKCKSHTEWVEVLKHVNKFFECQSLKRWSPIPLPSNASNIKWHL